ncbi:YfiT family bacillithiol transferase [uncultured Arcticibacterium sp.]|uniref:YfiT family bacillithiol transferase n=1 Tax=uncultured Arcticibacterium sp. TaxID=2173042 RepID=UPI0030F607FE
MENLQYPIGKFKVKKDYTKEEAAAFLKTLKEFPSELQKVVDGITDEQLATPYRPDGWTALQVIHHIADSHMNMLTRLKWTLTEDSPRIKAYYEDRWAILNDYSLPFQLSIDMLKVIHAKVVALLENLDEETLNRSYVHPETEYSFTLESVMALYAWHGAHHIAHIKICKGEWS